MKTSLFSSRGLGAALLAFCTVALPLTSYAARGGDPRNARGGGRAAPARAAPQARAAAPRAAPQRRAMPSRAMPQRRPAARAMPQRAPVSRAAPQRRATPRAAPPQRSSSAVIAAQRQRNASAASSAIAARQRSERAASVAGRERSNRVAESAARQRAISSANIDAARRNNNTRAGDSLARQRALSNAAAARRDGDSRVSDSIARQRAIAARRGDGSRLSRADWENRRYRDASRFSRVDRRQIYRSYPHNHYRVSYANGWRGRGYYYGPPNVPYYYDNPGVSFYSALSLIPAAYSSLRYSPTNSLDYSVQRALAERGYYYGTLDGDIGPESRLAIANFQADNGLEPTGIIDENLLSYLGI